MWKKGVISTYIEILKMVVIVKNFLNDQYMFIDIQVCAVFLSYSSDCSHSTTNLAIIGSIFA